MKIVQTLWSRPTHPSDNRAYRDRLQGGWLEKKYHLMSWALSCLSCCRYYEEVELVTDVDGKWLLIDALELPYTSIKVELDCLNHYDSNLWALGKLYAYRLQQAPFLHVDGDVYLWGRFEPRIESAELVAQNLEIDHHYYRKVLSQMAPHFKLPAFIQENIFSDEPLISVNAGILGGNNISFFKEYVDFAFDMIDSHIAEIQKIDDIGLSNTVFEQYFFYLLAQKKGIPITHYFSEPDPGNYSYLTQFYGVPHHTQYIHLIGKENKHSLTLLQHLENRLHLEFPDYYYRINRLLEEQVV